MSSFQLKHCLPQTQRIEYLSILFTRYRKCGIMWPEEGSSWPVCQQWIAVITDNSFNLHVDMQELFHGGTKWFFLFKRQNFFFLKIINYTHLSTSVTRVCKEDKKCIIIRQTTFHELNLSCDLIITDINLSLSPKSSVSPIVWDSEYVFLIFSCIKCITQIFCLASFLNAARLVFSSSSRKAWSFLNSSIILFSVLKLWVCGSQ